MVPRWPLHLRSIRKCYVAAGSQNEPSQIPRPWKLFLKLPPSQLPMSPKITTSNLLPIVLRTIPTSTSKDPGVWQKTPQSGADRSQNKSHDTPYILQTVPENFQVILVSVQLNPCNNPRVPIKRVPFHAWEVPHQVIVSAPTAPIKPRALLPHYSHP